MSSQEEIGQLACRQGVARLGVGAAGGLAASLRPKNENGARAGPV